ncbi:hypothetical protein HF638_02695 [Paenibacillus sp. SZ31]|uniref:hypothetical protein n=1 Tax=Paenibacillus sp. SZ31 TaxID=2725555 RepID=UPI00146CA004|nr:hypothetical protein [Paenibacillus sp. SZ31]NMI02864.1 hypothetical protein [Paenibacillus sp. SZ31]
MTGVAYNGSSVSQTSKSGHVTYDIENWVPTEWGGYWTSAGSGSTNAVITSSGTASNSTVYVNGRAVTCVNDPSPDTWTASPAVPTSNGSTRYINIRPATSGSGQGRVASGSTTVFAGAKAIGSVNSTVTTSLGTSARITTGSSNVYTN